MLRVIKICTDRDNKNTYIVRVNNELYANIKPLRVGWVLYYYKEKVFIYSMQLEPIIKRIEKELQFALSKRID